MSTTPEPISGERDKTRGKASQISLGDNRIQCVYLPHAGLHVYSGNKIAVLSKIHKHD
jgi:hypothetical protein